MDPTNIKMTGRSGHKNAGEVSGQNWDTKGLIRFHPEGHEGLLMGLKLSHLGTSAKIHLPLPISPLPKDFYFFSQCTEMPFAQGCASLCIRHG